MSLEAQNEIASWEESLTEYKSQPIWHSPSAVRVGIVMQVTVVMVDTWLSMALVWFVAGEQAKKQVRVLHGES